MENPLHDKPPPRKEPYPITVKCIVDCISDVDPQLLPFREHAHSLNINFVTREYNSWKYSEDRDKITKLPAFHIYVKKTYRETFYPNTRPYQIMKDTVEAYKIKQTIKKKTWTSFYTDLKSRLVALFHRTAMEKYNDGKLKDEKSYQKRIINWS
jgi:hypothetical protein